MNPVSNLKLVPIQCIPPHLLILVHMDCRWLRRSGWLLLEPEQRLVRGERWPDEEEEETRRKRRNNTRVKIKMLTIRILEVRMGIEREL